MKYLSLFSGIGGFELGIQQAYANRCEFCDKNVEMIIDNEGDEYCPKCETYKNNQYEISNMGRATSTSDTQNRRHKPMSNDSNGNGGRTNPCCIGFSEIDKYATEIYQKHFPNHKNHGDITTINEKELPDFDLLVGGFPCQSFSIAGKRGGFSDTRGTMFFEIARIVREKQPRLLLLENVKGLLSHDKGQTFRTIISTLDELGYDCQWQVLNSKNHGVPQNRERVFIIGHLRGTSRPEVFPFGGTDEETNVVSDKNQLLKWSKSRGMDSGKKREEERLLKSGTSQTLSTGDGCGNFSSKNYIQQLNQPKHSNDRIYDKEGLSPTLNTAQGGNRQPFIKIPEATKKGYAVASKGDSINLSVPNSKTRRGRVGKGLAQTLDTGMQQHTLQDSKIRRLTPTECERLQGFPDGWTEGLSDTQRYKTLGNAVTVNVIKDICEKLWK